jgi:hypothetical protein
MLRPSIAVAALFVTACLGAASGNLAARAKRQSAAAPTQLDYLVFASLADSQQPVSMVAIESHPVDSDIRR